MGKKISRLLKWSFGIGLFISFGFLLFQEFNLSSLLALTSELLSEPWWLIAMVTGYTCSFLLRSWCWRLLVDKSISIRVYLAGVFYSLFFNHLLPFKGGEAVRMGVLAQKQKGRWGMAIQSVLILRLIDLFWLGFFSVIGADLIGIDINLTFFITALVIFGVTVSGLIIYLKKHHAASFLTKQLTTMQTLVSSPHMILVLTLSCISWVAEGIVVFSVASLIGHLFTYSDAMWVTSLSVGSGVFQLAPGGFATYESVMSFSLNRVGFGWEEALSIAIVTHAFKYIYSFGAGLVAFYLYPLRFQELKSFMNKKGETS
ncbi:lysylphosphatidylglycerol synthase transmembrane domain-containing protein [Guptibacillus hwajinpoensis]|uniref:lysylphosphatidylglycerol synthase transmembrane domain-containing protein n=1 Tax=Guptibacillus hwajinpoensis TaxID=208199 RepID=UPI00384F89FC